MSEFNDRPLVADSIVGARHFDVDSLGRLCGVTHAAVWRPGVNEARCRKGEPVQYAMGGALYGLSPQSRRTLAQLAQWQSATITVEPDTEPDAVEDTHAVASKDCACGFYAYTDTDLGYSRPGRVVGIIRGTGVATVGTRGFRAERAEIVALVDPPRSARSLWNRLGEKVSDLIPFVIPLFGVSLVAVTTLAFAVSLAFLALMVLPAAALVGLVAAYQYDFSDRAPLHDRHLDADLRALVARNYPDVPRYRSLAAAMKDFPLSTPPEPSPVDDDFWTRSAS